MPAKASQRSGTRLELASIAGTALHNAADAFGRGPMFWEVG